MRIALSISLFMALIGLVGASGCKRASRQCEEFDRAQRTLDEISASTLDPTFEDPKFERALTEFEAIPEDCAQYQTAMTIAETIRSGMAKRKAGSLAAPPVSPAIATAPPPAQTAGGDTDAVKEYFAKVDAIGGADAKQRMQRLIQEAFEKKGDFREVIAEIERLEGEMHSITPPAPCQELHRLTFAHSAMGKKMMLDMETAIAAKDADAIAAIGGREPEIDAAEERLTQIEADLRRKYGVAERAR